MALDAEQLLLQVDMLASKTDPASNPGMKYNGNASINKGLNPSYFSATESKIVNAINKAYKTADVADKNVLNAMAKYNDILMDTSLEANAKFWNDVKAKMGVETIIEALNNLYSGVDQQQILDLKPGDAGKVLSVVLDEATGKMKTVAMAGGGGGPIDASDINYENSELPEIDNIKDAIDYIVANGTTIDWNAIQNKPDLADGISMTETELVLRSGDKDISIVPIVSDEDLELIFDSM